MYTMFIIICFVSFSVLVTGAPPVENQKDQSCTDPRTMRKHAAYTEWADAYSCTRHRCQPGGRNLAIYTVGCKRVEAPESAIECEEVVEDTNMQFPYCCTRLRCLVVVRGEVWTRVLGQPWETLPAAPWSHMYKMKKPPPVDSTFQPKEGAAAGPVYELSDPSPEGEQVMRTRKEKEVQRSSSASSAPDIVIALSTNSEKKPTPSDIQTKLRSRGTGYDGDRSDQHNEIDAEETPVITEKVPEIVSEERMYAQNKRYRGQKDLPTSEEYLDGRGQRGHKGRDTLSDEHLFSEMETKTSKGQKTWTRVPQEPWNGNSSPYTDTQMRTNDNVNDFDRERDVAPKRDPVVFRGEMSEEKRDEKTGSLQTLVNAIGTRMRDIENVVQQMSEKVQPPSESSERLRVSAYPKEKSLEGHATGMKKPNDDNYNRYPAQGSRFLRTGSESTTEPPLFAEDTNMNGYFSDPSNNLVRRANTRPKEPAETYMVPVNTEGHKKSLTEIEEPTSKHKKRTHKKKKSKHGKRKHRKEDKDEKKKNPSADLEKNTVSFEDSVDFGAEEEPDGDFLLPRAQQTRSFAPRDVWEETESLRALRLARMRQAAERAKYLKHVSLTQPVSPFRDIRRYQI